MLCKPTENETGPGPLRSNKPINTSFNIKNMLFGVKTKMAPGTRPCGRRSDRAKIPWAHSGPQDISSVGWLFRSRKRNCTIFGCSRLPGPCLVYWTHAALLRQERGVSWNGQLRYTLCTDWSSTTTVPFCPCGRTLHPHKRTPIRKPDKTFQERPLPRPVVLWHGEGSSETLKNRNRSRRSVARILTSRALQGIGPDRLETTQKNHTREGLQKTFSGTCPCRHLHLLFHYGPRLPGSP